jgi:hypothetical protein
MDAMDIAIGQWEGISIIPSKMLMTYRVEN